jgi:hypothetical protein
MIMYEIRDELNQLLAKAESLAGAEQAIEELCSQAHAQAAASDEGSSELWLRLRVVDENGEMVMFRNYNPDPSKPYVPLNEEDA